MLSRFAPFRRLNGSSHSQGHGVPTESPGTEGASSAFGQYAQPTPPDIPEAPEPDSGDGIYSVIKNTNYWFNRELYSLEQAARGEAARWAERGIPHHAALRDEPLPVEQALAVRCTEILRQWAERVRTKMQDAIEQCGQMVADRMVKLRFTLKQLESTQLELVNKEREASELREALRERETPFGYRALIGKNMARFVLVLLTIVEFVANFPVFRILLPLNATLAKNAEKLARLSIDKGIFSGLYHLLQDLLLRPEALAVSLVVVITVVVLSDIFGESLRPILALSEKENPSAAVGIKSHKRQHWLRVALCSLGMASVVTFLYYARYQIPQTAAGRVAADSAALVRIEAQVLAATQARNPAIGALTVQRENAERSLAIRQEEAAYAQTVQRSNTPILLLNVALLLAAAVIGYSKSSEDLKDQLSEDPRYVEVRNAIHRLRHEALQHRQAVRDAAAEVRVGISRVEHLLAARPLQEWRAKAERLQGVIPLFRAENARLRSLDPVEILAFQSDATVELPQVDEAAFRPPSGFDRYAEEFEELNEQFARIARHLHLTGDVEVGA